MIEELDVTEERLEELIRQRLDAREAELKIEEIKQGIIQKIKLEKNERRTRTKRYCRLGSLNVRYF